MRPELLSNARLWATASTTTRPAEQATVPATAGSESGLRLARFAGSAFAALGSTSQAKAAAKTGRLAVNGQLAEPARLLVAGDEVTLSGGRALPSALQDPKQVAARAAALEHDGFRIWFEDDELAVVHKPAGVHSKPYRGARHLEAALRDDSEMRRDCEVLGARHLEAALPALLGPPCRSTADALPAPSAVHRLDCRVCGLILVAKTRGAAAFLAEELAARRVTKRYRALLAGGIGGGGDPFEVREAVGGRPSLSIFKSIEATPHLQLGQLTTADLEPRTGRRHQLRLHAAALGAPILGDDLYGAPSGGGAGASLYLQSTEVRVAHPSGGGAAAVHVTAPEAARFARRRERARMGWEWERRHSGRRAGDIRMVEWGGRREGGARSHEIGRGAARSAAVAMAAAGGGRRGGEGSEARAALEGRGLTSREAAAGDARRRPFCVFTAPAMSRPVSRPLRRPGGVNSVSSHLQP